MKAPKPNHPLRMPLKGLAVTLAAIALTNPAQATDYWWDSNDTAAGFGNTTGIWGTSAFWSASNAGTATTTAAVTGSSDIVNFGTASLNYANGAIDITAAGVTVNSIIYGAGQSTAINLGSAGNTLTLDGATPTITVNHASTVQTIISPVAGSAGLTKAGTGILALSGSNSYTGATTIAAGTLSVNTMAPAGSNSSIGAFATAGATGLSFTGGTLNYTGASTTTDRGFTATSATKKTINVGAGASLTLGASVKNEVGITSANALTFTAGGAGGSITISSLTITAGSNPDFNISTNNPTVTIQNLNVTGSNVLAQRTGTALLSVGNINGSSSSGWLSNIKVTGAISGYTGGIILGGDASLLGLSSFNTTVTLQQAGIYTFNSIKNVGEGASALGNPLDAVNGTIGFGNGGNAPTFKYIGAGDTTDRVLNLRGSTGTVTLEQAGAGLLKFTSALTATGGGSKTLRLSGSTAGTGELAGAIVDNTTTNKTSVLKIGSGKWTLSGANTYTGTTTVTDGTLALGANDVLPGTAVSIGAATLDAATFTDTAGTLAVTGAATINLGSGAALAFADSAAVAWPGTLNVIGNLAVSSLRFGNVTSALTTAQRDNITVNGAGLGDYTLDANGYLIFEVVADTTAPTPNPMTWATAPVATGESSITMTATTATDPSGVEYFFTETTGNPGGTSSTAWQDSPVYTDTGLTPGTTYTYTVTARDKASAQTATTASAPASAATDAADITTPTPDPMTFDTPPAATSITKITMTATTATDPNGVEYYFDETSGNPGGSSSGWQDSPVYTDVGLAPGTEYTYTVKARDKSLANNESAASVPASATTDTEAIISKVWNVNIGGEVTTSDNFQGAAPENIPTGSTWNSVIAPLPKTNLLLADATGAFTAGVELDISAANLSGSITVVGSAGISSGNEIFQSWLGATGTTINMTVKGLSVSKTYDLVIYSDWYWKNGDSGYPVTQTLGSGLSGTIYTNRLLSGTNGTVPPLTEDTDAANNALATGNWYRIKELTPDLNGQLGFRLGDGANGPFNGFQLIDVTIDPGDVTPPNPDPMTWAIAPAATSESVITMTATSASDASAVEYLFTETSGNPGATSSAWQDSPVYTDTGLTPNTTYSYTATARDKSPNQNTTAPSGPAASATTDPADIIAPTPDPMTFATAPTATSISKITMTATTATDPYGVEYYFDCIAGGGHDSGWQDSPVYTDIWLAPGTLHTYTVTARDKSLAQNATAASAPASASTDTQDAGEILWSQPQNTTAVTDVVTTGTFHAARHGDGAVGAPTLTVNGVAFAPGPILHLGAESGTCLGSCPDELEALLDRLSWSYFGTTTTFTVTSLTPGAKYMIQIFLTDQRPPGPSGETFNDTVGNAVSLSGGNPGDTSTWGQFVIGTFTAKPDGTQTVQSTNAINAFQVRSVPASGNLYSTWATTNAGGQTPDLDFDNDGVDNGIEYFMGQTGSSFTAMPGLDGSNTITWPMSPAYSGTYEVQTSPDLVTWTNVDPRPTPSGGNLSYTLPPGLGKRFVRLLATPTP